MSLRLLVKLWSNVFTKPPHEDALEFTIELPGVSIKDIDAEMLLLQDTSFVTNSRLYIFKGGGRKNKRLLSPIVGLFFVIELVI
jgi:hypothetical protein